MHSVMHICIIHVALLYLQGLLLSYYYRLKNYNLSLINHYIWIPLLFHPNSVARNRLYGPYIITSLMCLIAGINVISCGSCLLPSVRMRRKGYGSRCVCVCVCVCLSVYYQANCHILGLYIENKVPLGFSWQSHVLWGFQ
jgi:hypothetical protein